MSRKAKTAACMARSAVNTVHLLLYAFDVGLIKDFLSNLIFGAVHYYDEANDA
jgi:hypothetical protein